MSFGLKKHHWEERKSINRSFLSWCWMWFLLSNHSIFDCKLNYYYIIDLVIWCRLVSDLFILFKLLIPSKPNLQSAHIFIIYWVLAVKLEKRYMMSLCWDVLMKPWQRGLLYGLLGGLPTAADSHLHKGEDGIDPRVQNYTPVNMWFISQTGYCGKVAC